jgi:hypothetical protein
MSNGDYQAPWETMTTQQVSWVHWHLLRMRGWATEAPGWNKRQPVLGWVAGIASLIAALAIPTSIFRHLTKRFPWMSESDFGRKSSCQRLSSLTIALAQAADTATAAELLCCIDGRRALAECAALLLLRLIRGMSEGSSGAQTEPSSQEKKAAEQSRSGDCRMSITRAGPPAGTCSVGAAVPFAWRQMSLVRADQAE